MPGQQVPGQQVPGQQVPGQQVPGQQVPGQQLNRAEAATTNRRCSPSAFETCGFGDNDRNSAKICKPIIPPYEEYKWQACPSGINTICLPTASDNCTKGCNRNCSCAKNSIPCDVSCRCQESAKKWNREIYTLQPLTSPITVQHLTSPITVNQIATINKR